MSPCKMINLLQDVMTNLSPKNVICMEMGGIPQDHGSKGSFEAPNKYFMPGKANQCI